MLTPPHLYPLQKHLSGLFDPYLAVPFHTTSKGIHLVYKPSVIYIIIIIIIIIRHTAKELEAEITYTNSRHLPVISVKILHYKQQLVLIFVFIDNITSKQL